MSWSDSAWGALIGAALSAYQYNQNSKANDKQNQANQEAWQKGYWNVRSPYMESMIAPQIQALLAKAGQYYGSQLGMDTSQFPSSVGQGGMYGGFGVGMGGPGGAPTSAPFPQGPPGAYGGGAPAEPGDPDRPGHDSGPDMHGSGAGGGNYGGLTYDSHGGTNIADSLYLGAGHLEDWQGAHPGLTRAISALGNQLLSGSGTAFNKLPEWYQKLYMHLHPEVAPTSHGGSIITNSNHGASDGNTLGGFNFEPGQSEPPKTAPVPSSTTSGGWNNSFGQDSSDFWSLMQPGLGVTGGGHGWGYGEHLGGGSGEGRGSQDIYGGSASPWDWGNAPLY